MLHIVDRASSRVGPLTHWLSQRADRRWPSFLTNARFEYNIQGQLSAVLTLEKIREKYSPLPRLLGALYPSEITNGMFGSSGGRNRVHLNLGPGLKTIYLDATAMTHPHEVAAEMR